MKGAIVQHDKDTKNVLRNKARAITKDDFETGLVKAVLAKMASALASRSDGVALAAPQIGESLNMFIVSGKIFDTKQSTGPTPDLVFINPTIKKLSKETIDMEEGCLSVADLYGKVKRSKTALLKAQDATGKDITIEGTGLLAQIFQHECDHLHGVLFIDKAFDLHPPHHA